MTKSPAVCTWGRNDRRRRGPITRRLLISVMVLCSVCLSASSDVWYVDIDTPAIGHGQDGRSWATAYATLQDGLDAAHFDGGGDVWVAEGVYTGTTTYVLTLRENVHVWGGFLGNAPEGYETVQGQRDWRTHRTVIDGQGARACVQGAPNATLDGFTLRNGRGVQVPMGPPPSGGGMRNEGVSPTIAHCLFVNNSADSGGAMVNADASPLVKDCVFLANSVDYNGAAMQNTGDASPRVISCVFALNTSTYQCATVCNISSGTPEFRACAFVENRSLNVSGGAMENLYGSPLVANCLFIHNAAVSAGALHNSNASPLIVNCTFDANRANIKAGAIVNSGSTAATVVNSILWNSSPAAIYDEADSVTTVVYSNVQGGWSGEGNLSPSRIPRFSAVPSGMATAMSYDADACLTILTHTGAAFTPQAFAGAILWVSTDIGEAAYVIVDNHAETIAVWGDVTKGGAVGSPVGYAVVNYRLAPDSPCIDAGRDTSAPEWGGVTTDFAGEPRGIDGLNDGPTGPPAPGDGSDYDMGAYEAARYFAPADVNRSGEVDAMDVQLVINAALSLETEWNCDTNGDGAVNAVDIQGVINAALGL